MTPVASISSSSLSACSFDTLCDLLVKLGTDYETPFDNWVPCCLLSSWRCWYLTQFYKGRGLFDEFALRRGNKPTLYKGLMLATLAHDIFHVIFQDFKVEEKIHTAVKKSFFYFNLRRGNNPTPASCWPLLLMIFFMWCFRILKLKKIFTQRFKNIIFLNWGTSQYFKRPSCWPQLKMLMIFFMWCFRRINILTASSVASAALCHFLFFLSF